MTAAAARILIVETSTRRAVLALAQGPTLLETTILEESRRHARDLAPLTGAMLRRQGWSPRQLDAVFAGRGPGSYTGLRVGLIAAKTLCYATSCALVALDTFDVLASQAPLQIEKVDIIGDAQQDKVYAQSFQRSGGEMQAVGALEIVVLSEWLERRDPQAWLSGPGVSAKQKQLPPGLMLVEQGLRDPQAEGLLRLGLAHLERGERADVFAVEPIYLRPSAAEEQWDRLRSKEAAARHASAGDSTIAER